MARISFSFFSGSLKVVAFILGVASVCIMISRYHNVKIVFCLFFQGFSRVFAAQASEFHPISLNAQKCLLILGHKAGFSSRIDFNRVSSWKASPGSGNPGPDRIPRSIPTGRGIIITREPARGTPRARPLSTTSGNSNSDKLSSILNRLLQK